MAELHVYDFDGTLFRSPDKPDWWEKGTGSWVYNPASLDVPCVPTRPGGDFWIGSTVADAKKSISRPDVYAILVTGRGDKSFARYRVPELLKQKGLSFDEVHLSPGGSTKSFKIQVINRILGRFPDIDRVDIWEDDLPNLKAYMQAVNQRGLVGQPHPVVVTRAQPACTREDYMDLVGQGWLKERYSALRVAARWMEARIPTDESKQFRLDERNRAKHVKDAARAFKELLARLRPIADQSVAAHPDKDKMSMQRRGRVFSKAMKVNADMATFLDTWIGREDQHPKAYSWRGAVVYQARDALLYGKTLRDALEEVGKQADKGFQAITMAEAQAPIREALPADLREFLPTNIVVDVDGDGIISKVTDRFENEHFTLGKKIERMHQLVADYNRIAQLVKKDLRSRDEATRLSALITAIIMETGIRPGKEGNAAIKTVDGEKVEVETFGAITLGPAHVRFIRDNFVELEFLGKKGGHNTATLSDAIIIKALDNYVQQALKSGSKYVFVMANGTRFTYTDLLRYFREHFSGLAPTDFRKLKATEEVLHAIHAEQENLYARIRSFAKKAKGDLKERVVAAIVETLDTAITKAQEALSHENASTTRRSYINPEIIFKFLSTGRVDSTLEAAILDGRPSLGFDPQVFVDRAMARTAAGKTTLRDLLRELEEDGVTQG